MTRTRGYLSPMVAANGEATAAGSQRTSPMSPTAPAPPTS